MLANFESLEMKLLIIFSEEISRLSYIFSLHFYDTFDESNLRLLFQAIFNYRRWCIVFVLSRSAIFLTKASRFNFELFTHTKYVRHTLYFLFSSQRWFLWKYIIWRDGDEVKAIWVKAVLSSECDFARERFPTHTHSFSFLMKI
jgi:hypothetical protein